MDRQPPAVHIVRLFAEQGNSKGKGWGGKEKKNNLWSGSLNKKRVWVAGVPGGHPEPIVGGDPLPPAMSNTARRAPQEIRILLAVLPAANFVFLVLAYRKVVWNTGFQLVEHQVNGVLYSSSSSRTSMLFIISMRVEKFCSSTGAS